MSQRYQRSICKQSALQSQINSLVGSFCKGCGTFAKADIKRKRWGTFAKTALRMQRVGSKRKGVPEKVR